MFCMSVHQRVILGYISIFLQSALNAHFKCIFIFKNVFAVFFFDGLTKSCT